MNYPMWFLFIKKRRYSVPIPPSMINCRCWIEDINETIRENSLLSGADQVIKTTKADDKEADNITNNKGDYDEIK